MLPAAPSDVLAVWTGNGPVQDIIRIGDVVEGRPAVANHVVGLTHRDKRGRWMGLEGRPGGFGLVDATPYLSDPRTRTNHGQPRTPDDVTFLLAGAARLTGTPYDWVGIGEDDLLALHLDDMAAAVDRLWAWPVHGGLLPGHVVCSSAWAWLYAARSLARPALGRERSCTPGMWWDFNNGELWRGPR
jgi:hypothetical protein